MTRTVNAKVLVRTTATIAGETETRRARLTELENLITQLEQAEDDAARALARGEDCDGSAPSQALALERDRTRRAARLIAEEIEQLEAEAKGLELGEAKANEARLLVDATTAAQTLETTVRRFVVATAGPLADSLNAAIEEARVAARRNVKLHRRAGRAAELQHWSDPTNVVLHQHGALIKLVEQLRAFAGAPAVPRDDDTADQSSEAAPPLIEAGEGPATSDHHVPTVRLSREPLVGLR